MVLKFSLKNSLVHVYFQITLEPTLLPIQYTNSIFLYCIIITVTLDIILIYFTYLFMC